MLGIAKVPNNNNSDIPNKNNNNDNDILLQKKNLQEEDTKKCNILKQDLGQIVEQNSYIIGKDMVNLSRQLLEVLEQNPDRVNLKNFETFPELLNAVIYYSKNELYRKQETLDHIDRYARLMAKNEQPFPIDFFNLNYNQYKLHMNWYKNNFYDEETGKNFYGLKHRKDTIDTFNKAFGLPDGWFPYRLPPRPNHKEIIIPNPETVHKMINYKDYHSDKDINKLIQYILAYGFWFGTRNPSELVNQKLSKIYFNEGYMIITEPKKYNTTRQIFPESNIFAAATRKSLKNYVDKLRPKFETSRSKDYLFIKPSDGSPFNRRYFGKMQSQYGKMVYPIFHPYMTRHWCATARYIRARIKKSEDPKTDVQEFLGHEEQKTTENYISLATKMGRLYPYDWINRTLKKPDYWLEESAIKSKQGKKTFVSNGNPSRVMDGPAEI